LKDPRLEAFAQGLALGLDVHVAHERAGFAKDPSRSNSSKAARKQAVVDRVAEIKAELEAQRKLATGGADGFTAKSLVAQAVGMALAQGDPQVLASIAKFLDDAR
jgi:alkylation response protein AidB-like acyl-CoA dehydrogenase